jgi:antitoxin component of MazEF toxin-antitoxin module
MLMLKKLTTIGSSKGLILDKTLLGLLGIEDAEEVSITVEGRRLIITPPYKSPVDELRARVTEAHDGDDGEDPVGAAVRRLRPETIAKVKAGRGGRRS